VRKSDLLAELTDVLSDGVSQDLWLLSVGIDNNPWGQYQPLFPSGVHESGIEICLQHWSCGREAYWFREFGFKWEGIYITTVEFRLEFGPFVPHSLLPTQGIPVPC